ncbi:uncharacterized protein F5891DRAFT_1172497 [Suillus fuscotomentosus]|uniref:Uncharacterized protein n=1 Tax=Suillus fuscotomentosus TaxID=1912939 RepID=A0AAD4HM82_9AGAM|nr:uncharacterized protein F5891DRAFT_1172497 [Suillus fuscotomentosus]KAG1901783.1 hypothetical protein F5891DRAFT_1172497 [Suillus fuscotomentosus]
MKDSEAESLHSDALDDLPPKKRTRSSNSKPSSPSKPKAKRNKRKAKGDDVKDEEDVDGSDVDLKEGQQVVGRVVQAPKTGWVPPGQVSQNTLDFLAKLKALRVMTVNGLSYTVRFSNDKTPYKKGLSASFSRSGRKGIFAFFKPGDESVIAAGAWCPAKNELLTLRLCTQSWLLKHLLPISALPAHTRMEIGEPDELPRYEYKGDT